MEVSIANPGKHLTFLTKKWSCLATRSVDESYIIFRSVDVAAIASMKCTVDLWQGLVPHTLNCVHTFYFVLKIAMPSKSEKDKIDVVAESLQELRPMNTSLLATAIWLGHVAKCLPTTGCSGL